MGGGRSPLVKLDIARMEKRLAEHRIVVQRLVHRPAVDQPAIPQHAGDWAAAQQANLRLLHGGRRQAVRLGLATAPHHQSAAGPQLPSSGPKEVRKGRKPRMRCCLMRERERLPRELAALSHATSVRLMHPTPASWPPRE